MTVPTTRPRSAGSARWAANGTSSCGVIVVTPTARLAAASQAKLGAAATPSRATVTAPSIARMNDRRSKRSPKGKNRSIPVA